MTKTNKPLVLRVGSDYRTRGGWRARIIWNKSSQNGDNYYVIHYPKELNKETGPIFHIGTVPYTQFSVSEPPTGGLHPAELVAEWNGSPIA